VGETANGRTGEARIRAAGSMSLSVSCVKANGLDLCGVAASPIRRFAHSPSGSFSQLFHPIAAIL
jgi:hypothetical protein